jgi:mRNA interferase MazF
MAEPKRGEVWLTDLEPARGDEMHKRRSAAVIADDAVGKLALTIVAPITARHDAFASAPWLIRIIPNPTNGLSKVSAADAFQVRSVSVSRLTTRIGVLDSQTVDLIADAVALCVGASGRPQSPSSSPAEDRTA